MWTVYYRTGGTENFKWRKCIPVNSRQEAIEQVEACRKAGYPAHYDRTEHVEANGLPDTFAPGAEHVAG